MTLLQEIQSAATDCGVEISTVLRKAKILAVRLQNLEFERWVDCELNGYADHHALPSYRIIRVVARGELSNGYQIWRAAPIMTSFLPENLRDWGERAYLPQPISGIAALAQSAEESELHLPWPQELAAHYGAKGYNRWECLGAWQVITRPSLVSVVEQVRNRVLEFALKIEATAPDAGEIPVGSGVPISQEKITQIFQTYVYGNANNVAAGGSQLSQSATSQIKPGDMESLLRYLRGLGICDEDVSALERLADSSPSQRTAAEGWLGKLAMSASTGAASAVFGLAVKAVAQYFGVPLP